jgi:hypothetical protein
MLASYYWKEVHDLLMIFFSSVYVDGLFQVDGVGPSLLSWCEINNAGTLR